MRIKAAAILGSTKCRLADVRMVVFERNADDHAGTSLFENCCLLLTMKRYKKINDLCK